MPTDRALAALPGSSPAVCKGMCRPGRERAAVGSPMELCVLLDAVPGDWEGRSLPRYKLRSSAWRCSEMFDMRT